MNYYIATDRFGNYSLEHGVKWRQHKYIRKEGNRYIYPEDLAKGGKKSKGVSTSGKGRALINLVDDYASPNKEWRYSQDTNPYRKDNLFKDPDSWINGYDATIAAQRRGIARTNSEKQRAAQKAVNAAQERGRKRTGKELQRKNDLLNVVDKYQKQGWTRTFRESEKTHHPEAYNSQRNNAQQELNARAARHAVEYYDKKKKKEHPVQYYADKGKNWLKNLLKKK